MIERMLAALPRPEAVIVGEPSEMRVVTGQKGSWGFRARVRGHEVHSSLLPTGVSAVMEAAGMIDWMRRTMDANARTTPPNDFDPPYTTIHVGLIAGGTANNITARDCSFSGEVRTLPDESVASWRERILAEAARRSAAMQAIHPDAGIAFETRMDLPGFAAAGPAEALARRADRRQRPPRRQLPDRGRPLPGPRPLDGDLRPRLDRPGPPARRVHHRGPARRRQRLRPPPDRPPRRVREISSKNCCAFSYLP